MSRPMSHFKPVIFGEVLFDCFPDGSRVLGGAPFNVAWHCQAFGLQPLFISRIGNDPLGREVRKAMLDWGMDTSGLQLDSAHPTGIVDVSINNDEPSYEIVENSAWDYIDHKATPNIDDSSVLYHGSLALRNQVTAESLEDLVENGSNSIFIDVNLRPPWWQSSTLEKLILKSRWVKLNEDELAQIIPQEASTEGRIDYILSKLDTELVVVTRGEAGAIAVSRDRQCTVEPENKIQVVDTVGAGDAFSSVLLLGLHKAWPLQKILQRAQHFASAVVGQRGATTKDKRFYQPYIKQWGLSVSD